MVATKQVKPAQSDEQTRGAASWGAAVALAHLSANETAHDAAMTLEQGRRTLQQRVLEQGPGFVESMKAESEKNLADFNLFCGRVVFRLRSDRSGGFAVATDSFNSSLSIEPNWTPNDPAPSLLVRQRVTGSGHAGHYYFSATPDGGLALLLGDACQPVAAVRQILEPWLRQVCLRVDEQQYRAQAQRWSLDPVIVPIVQAPTIRVEIATADDAIPVDDVLAIETSSFAGPWTAGMFRKAVDDGRLMVATAADQRIVAFGVIGRRRTGDALVIMRLAVAEDVRRRGIGTALMHHMLSQGAETGAPRAELDVNALNFTAHRLYARVGFVPAVPQDAA
jgi:[ribosomal protein S18]-alanine N-acetyltransferase